MAMDLTKEDRDTLNRIQIDVGIIKKTMTTAEDITSALVVHCAEKHQKSMIPPTVDSLSWSTVAKIVTVLIPIFGSIVAVILNT